MANQPKTPQRSVRVPDDRWQRAKAAAATREEDLSVAINRFLERYAKQAEQKPTASTSA